MTGGAGDRGTQSGAPRRGRVLSIVAAVLLLIGGGAVTVGLLGQQSAPQAASVSSVSSASAVSSPPPTPSATTTVSSDAASPTASVHPGSAPASAPAGAAGSGRSAGAAAKSTAAAPKAGVTAAAKPSTKPTTTPAVAAAEPVALRIPAIGVQSNLIKLGLNPDNSLEVPQPGPDYDKAGWFTGSPAPGEVGPAVIEGHIDSAANGPSVFFQLGAVTPGNDIEIDRADGSTVRFVVDKVTAYPKDAFPTLEVYGNTSRPELRVITCGGDFDAAKGSYRDNTVVYAHLSS